MFEDVVPEVAVIRVVVLHPRDEDVEVIVIAEVEAVPNSKPAGLKITADEILK